jgi:hypothetical protein
MKLGERLNYWHPGHLDVYEETKNGKTFSMVPVDRIREFLDTVPVNYAYHVTQSGNMGNGATYVAITLRVEFEDGVLTVPGGSDSTHIGYPGLIGEALRNAVLRGLSMGKALYEQADNETPATSTETYQNQGSLSQQTLPTNGDTSTGYTPTRGNRPAWDGAVKFKQGKYAGRSYSEVPDDYIEFLAGKGTETAILELERRGRGRQAQETVQEGSRNFPARPFNR